jgi:hypothetical protein
MSFISWVQNNRSALAPSGGQRNHKRRGALRAAKHRPILQLLEDRWVPSFSPAVSYPTGTNPLAVLTADFNGDGRLDLAVTNNTVGVLLGSVSVLLGNADGTFQPAQNSATGTYPWSLAVGDYNADGKLDLATANGSSSDVSVLLGNADGTFKAPTNINIGSDPQSVAVGDFNADGKLDLGVTSNLYVIDGYTGYYGYTFGHYEGSANVLLGNGDGTFAAPNSNTLGGGHTSAAVADFNGDGKQDFATVNSDGNTVSVLPGTGTGTLGASVAFGVGNSPDSVAAGDVNADGKIDLVTANRYGYDVSVLLGDGLGGFGAAQNYAVFVFSEPKSVVLGDFNHDTKLDIATANFSGNNVSVLLGRGNGTFSAAVNSAAGPRASAVAAGDFNGDGWLDAVTANYFEGNASVVLNDQSWPSTPPPPPPSVAINDVTVTEGNTGAANATFTVSLSIAYMQPVTVHFATADATATAGSDYTAVSGDLTFAAGQTSQTVTVAVLGDRLGESTETFAVNLSAPVNATIGDGQGIGAILDDEPRIGINDVTGAEGNTGTRPATFTASLSAAYDVPVTVGYATANGAATAGSDYQAASGTLTIPAGQTSGTITVLVNGDRLAEPNETFFVNLSNLNYGVITDGQGVGSIVDDEPRISISDVTRYEGWWGQATLFSFTVRLSTAYDQAVTMSYRTVDGTATTGDGDYVAKSGTLTFSPGETTKTISIVVSGDTKREANETFYVDLFGNTSNSLFTKSRGIGTILNDD